MQIDVNSAADRLHLTRAQLSSMRSAQLNSKAAVSTAGRTLTKVASAPVRLTDIASAPGKLTDFASAPSKLTDLASAQGRLTDFASAPAEKISDVRTNPLVTPKAPTVVPLTPTVRPDGTGATSPTPGQIADPAGDSKSSAQTLAKSPVVSDQGPTEPTNRLDALLADWGQSDSPYDLDGDGIVGVSDLLILLAGLSEGPPKPEPPHGDVAGAARLSAEALAEPRLSDHSNPNPTPTNDLDALLADWGQSDSPYDLDRNGNVGVNDLLMLLSKLSGGGSPQPKEPHGDVAIPSRPRAQVLAEPPARPNTPHDPSVAPGKRVAIGVNAATIAEHVIDQLDQDNSGTITPPEVNGSTSTFDRLDRNHDGALSRSELAAQIRGMLLDHIAMSPNAKLDQFVREAMNRLSDHDNRNGAPGQRDAAVQRSSSQAYLRMNLEEIAHKLMQRLTDYGPSGLANFVQAGQLSADDAKVVINRISMLNPNKLGVNVVG